MKTFLVSLHQRFKSLTKPVRVGIYLLTAYATYALLLGLIVPAIIQSQAPDMLSEQLGRKVQIAKVRINPFLLRTRISGFAIAEQDETTRFIQFDQLELEFSFWRTIRHLTPVIDHLDIQNPVVNVARLDITNGTPRFNFSDIQETLAKQASKAPQTEEPQPESTGIPGLIADRLSILQGQLHIRDQVTGTKLDYPALDIALNQMDTRAFTLSVPDNAETGAVLAEESNRYALSLTGADKGQLALSGQFQLQPLEVNGDLQLSGLTLPPFWPLAADMIPAQLTSGSLRFSTDYHLIQNDENIQVNTENGQFALTNLVFSADSEPKVALPELTVENISADTGSQKINLDSICLSGLTIDAAMDKNGTVDLQSLFTPVVSADKDVVPSQTNTDETVADDPQPEPWLISLNRFVMSDSDINLTEKLVSQGVHWRIYPLSLSTDRVLSDLSQPVDYQLSMNISSSENASPQQSRGAFSSNGQINADALAADGEIKLTALDLSQFQPYLKPYLNVELSSGGLSTEGAFSADSQGKATYQGRASVDNLLIKDGLEHEPLIKWKTMAMDSMQFDLQQQSLNIATIQLDEPYAKVLIAKDRRTNIGEIMARSDSSATNETEKTSNQTSDKPETDVQVADTAKGPAFDLDIGKIEVRNGSAYFADYSLTPNFASGIEDLQGYINHLSSDPATRAEVALQGKVDRYAPVTLSGEVNPLLTPPYLDLDFILDSAELTSVNPYSGTYVGYYIDKGQLSLDINYLLDNNQLKGSNHVVIDQLQLGKASESDLATSLPVSLAIALLQDTDGVIDLGVDVSGDLDSPDFSLGGIILKAIGNIITKAVTAPFSLLANLIGSDEELNLVQFDPGLAVLTPAEEARLRKLANALTKRPKLAVSVEGSVNPKEDSHALAEAQLQQKLLQLSGLSELPANLTASRIPATGPLATALEQLSVQELNLDITAERSKIEKQLQAETEEVTDIDLARITSVLHIGMYNQLLSAQEISPDSLGNLADARAKATKAFLVEGAQLDPGRIFILDSKTELKTDAAQALLTLDAK
ncbi:hypothetical protein DI392_14290 [Vibrio albus]|uniref:DUF748 domain-containing protein n=1 Tax=Vibrio albus TaxID=2200953 RepID=A0A2U3B721_9VIBR|nr:DUF748 domain-containing protein [Vibrio albus]PWI32587.1 hypothetical protein DI392_14290 [Vibrio albus]